MRKSSLDRLIEYVSPQWGAQRSLARACIVEAERMVGFRDATATRMDKSIGSRGTSPDWNLELGFDRRNMVDRARQLDRDDLLASALLDVSTLNVVGTGFELRCTTKDDGWNRAFEQYWTEWCLKADCRGIHTFNEMLALMYRGKLRDGDAAWVFLSDGTIRQVESDEIASPTGGFTRPNDVDGVELDARGRPINYYVFAPDPNVLWGDRRSAVPAVHTVIPADYVTFLARRTRSGQTRGLTAFNGISWLLEQLSGTMEAVTTAVRLGAIYGLVFERADPFGGLGTTPAADGTTRQKLSTEPAQTIRAAPGETVKQIQPTQPGANFGDHTRLLIRVSGSRFGLPLELVIGDLSQTSYSSMRGGLLQCHRKWMVEQQELSHAATRVKNWVLVRAIEDGDMTFRKDADSHLWLKPGWQWVDPEVEVAADAMAVDLAIESRSAICARRGKRWDDTLKELAREEKMIEAAGLPRVMSNQTREAGGEPGEPKRAAKPKPAAAAHFVNRLRSPTNGTAPHHTAT